MKCNSAIYPGSFDPPTLAHLWVISAASKIFHNVVVGIAHHPTKNYCFSAHERFDMLNYIIDRDFKDFPNVTVDYCGMDLTVDYCAKHDISHIVRGIRSASDFEYERRMQKINSARNADIQTLFLSPPEHLDNISSSTVRELCLYKHGLDEASRYVDHSVMRKLNDKFKTN